MSLSCSCALLRNSSRLADFFLVSFTTSEIVTVLVGPKRKRFYLHRDLICQRSPFMEKCLSKNRFSEGDKNELYLPEDDPKAFSVLVEWIYRGRLPGIVTPGSASVGYVDVVDMSAAYCMADKFGMEELQNGIMDCVRASYRANVASHHAHTHGHSHTHHGIGSSSGNTSRDPNSRPVSMFSHSTITPAERDGPEATRPTYAALSLCHLSGPHKSPLKRFFIEHLVYHMMTYPKYYQSDFNTKGSSNSSSQSSKAAAAAAAANNSGNNTTSNRSTPAGSAANTVIDDLRTARERENFEKLFELPDLSLLIMRKIWQWQTERWGDPSKDRGCAYHVHASTLCEHKKSSSGMNASGLGPSKSSIGAGDRSSSQNSIGNPVPFQGLPLNGGAARSATNWRSVSGATSGGLIGGWHPGVAW